MTRRSARLARDEGGATAVEYGLIAAGVGLAVLTAYWTLGDSLHSRFSEIAAAIGVETQDDGDPSIIFQTRDRPD